MGMLQMTWQPGLVKLLKRKQGSPPLGLRNLGNSCYLNSVLQCLTYTPPLASFCLRFLHSSICTFSSLPLYLSIYACDLGVGKEKKGECPFCILEKRIVRSLSIEAVSDSPLRINSCLRIYAEHFRTGRQEDAHEFLRYVIDACHNTCLRLKKLHQPRRTNGVANGGDIGGTGETVVQEIFGGALQSQVECLSCGAESIKVDEIMDISLDILHSGSLKASLQKFFQPEVLDGNNKYKCDSCKELVAARKQMSILQAPNVLVIQLKRFEGMFGGKIDKPIAFDETLLLSSYMCKASQGSRIMPGQLGLYDRSPVSTNTGKQDYARPTLDLHPEYNLCGTIVHSGSSPDSGHYYAYIKDACGRWYCCNDSYVSVSSLQEVLSEKVYILFFSRTKQRPRARVDLVANGSKSHESNGSKTPIIQKLGCQEKSTCSRQTSDNHSERNNSTKSQESNGTEPFIQKSGYLEKHVIKKISANHSKTNNSTTYIASNGTKTATISMSDRAETPMSMTGISNNHSEPNISVPSFKSNGSNSSGIQKVGALVEPVSMDASNHHSLTSNSTKRKVDQRFSSQQNNVSVPGSTKKLFATGNSEISVHKRESKDENGSKEASITSDEIDQTGLPVNERNGMSKNLADVQTSKEGPSSLGNNSGQTGTIAVDASEISIPEFNGGKTIIASQNRLNCKYLQNGDVMGSSNNSGLKRKTTDSHSCILLARDAPSRARVEDFKEMIGKEASLILQSCGWSEEVHKFMSKKLRQEVDDNASNDHEKK
ncbi:hypothetical protein RD792_007217 [Penstemon davidsonii]|uniref:Ubiquitin carboxyl-terminal hydrolase n=1 Tax=Penstemon davidsonii TaxID=160366 RepID=A0ABR0D7L5_9LAMI|nr:hypothetical protein RD792_007217 [Penstemon davidsonii]